MDWQQLLDHIERFDVHLFTLGGTEITVSSAFKLVAFTLLLVWASRRVRDWTVNRALHRTHLDLGTREAVGSIMRYAVLVVGAMLILQNAGINLSAFSVLAGAVGVGVGFGLQNIISNFVSGLIIMLERPIKIGDRVEVGGIEGVVHEIGPRRTTVVTNDRLAILVPNQRFILDNVVNQVYTEQPIRLRIAVQVASGTDTQVMHDLLVDAANSHPDVLKQPAPEALVTMLGGPATAYELAVWHEARGPRRQQLASDLSYQVAQRLKAHDIKPA
ncbi:mechanosensitive ion channel family protein [Piscinibacter terrae]|nr:mechanosensitive ion channel domain-containing protein [Albitalea terrae]